MPVRRWWVLIHPADRPIAQKYLLLVMGRSAAALEAIGDGLMSAAGSASAYPSLPTKRLGGGGSGGRHQAAGSASAYPSLPTKRLKIVEQIVKETGVRPAV